MSEYLLAELICVVCQKTAPPAPRHKKWLSRFGKTQHCTTNDLPMCRARAGDSHALLGTLRSNPEHSSSMFASPLAEVSHPHFVAPACYCPEPPVVGRCGATLGLARGGVVPNTSSCLPHEQGSPPQTPGPLVGRARYPYSARLPPGPLLRCCGPN